MRFAGLGSGSAGNGILIATASANVAVATTVLVDCGFTLQEAIARLARYQIQPPDLQAILVTHEHSDHIGGVERLARRFKIPIYLTRGTYMANRWQKPEDLKFNFIEGYAPFSIGDLAVQPYAVPHDAREPAQFIFIHQNKKIGLLTDAGHPSAHLTTKLRNLDGLLLECNHELMLLEQSNYPYSLKRRISGDFGHLSNCAAAKVLAAIAHPKLQYVVAAHLSKENNCPALAEAALSPVLATHGIQSRLRIACQEQGFGWLNIN